LSTSAPTPLHSEFLDFGDSLVEQARGLVLSLWNRSGIYSELKDDQTPVSEVDLRCEELVREQIRKRFPSHGIIGEEFGVENGDAEFVKSRKQARNLCGLRS
jgi:inositol-phosphate phosphatase/L-galactose 1-phosphate phosphatase/histidinol-phosphatase